MNSAALENPVFRGYLFVLAGILAVAGALIALLRFVFRKNVDHAWKAYRGWLIMIPITFAALYFGRETTILFFTLLALAAFTEFARATGLYRDWGMTGVALVGIAAVGVVSFMNEPDSTTKGWYGMLMALPVYVVAAILMIPILRDRAKGQLQPIALALLGFIYMGWMFGHMAFLANARNAYGYLLFLLFAVPLCDVSAFTFGKIFGRHKFRPNVSPNKTWEGAIGALAVSMAFPWLVRFSFPELGTRELLLAGIIVGIGGQLGDLSISVIKRDIGIKDMGALIEGHGGVLDRVDSLIYVAPLFFHMVRYFQGLQ
ncbi:MAG TPA: phosphatidate cytidylyltransferase [Thermoanaerobaculia bacterium]|jgi:phosphatidate cytidylyltransferase|nr:phosphatidate cytidylyltransferase [Thermoanaerobaculia bacterium]